MPAKWHRRLGAVPGSGKSLSPAPPASNTAKCVSITIVFLPCISLAVQNRHSPSGAAIRYTIFSRDTLFQTLLNGEEYHNQMKLAARLLRYPSLLSTAMPRTSICIGPAPRRDRSGCAAAGALTLTSTPHNRIHPAMRRDKADAARIASQEEWTIGLRGSTLSLLLEFVFHAHRDGKVPVVVAACRVVLVAKGAL